MYLYNISVIIEEQAHDSLLDWIEREWLPTLQHDVSFLKMLYSPHEGHTYCIQMRVHSEQDIQMFNDHYLHVLRQHIISHYAEKAFLFDSVMQYLSR